MTGTSSSKATVAFSLAPYHYDGLGERKEQWQDVKFCKHMRADIVVKVC